MGFCGLLPLFDARYLLLHVYFFVDTVRIGFHFTRFMLIYELSSRVRYAFAIISSCTYPVYLNPY
jgi:hypothetical protein